MAERNFGKLVNAILDVIFPPRCPGCGEVISLKATDAFCPQCREKWEKHKVEYCKRCGQRIDNCWCGVPLDKNSDITAEYHLVQYDKTANTVIKNLIYNIKNFNRKLVSDTIAREMYNELYPRVDFSNLVICYVPRSKGNIRKYGHDQSMNIAYAFSALSGIEVTPVLYHEGDVNQKQLNNAERRKNAQASYHIINGAGKAIKNKTVILIDDVVTTGSSVTRCAKLLNGKGAKRVLVFSIAKTV